MPRSPGLCCASDHIGRTVRATLATAIACWGTKHTGSLATACVSGTRHAVPLAAMQLLGGNFGLAHQQPVGLQPVQHVAVWRLATMRPRIKRQPQPWLGPGSSTAQARARCRGPTSDRATDEFTYSRLIPTYFVMEGDADAHDEEARDCEAVKCHVTGQRLQKLWATLQPVALWRREGFLARFRTSPERRHISPIVHRPPCQLRGAHVRRCSPKNAKTRLQASSVAASL